jgi:hypothetical protein
MAKKNVVIFDGEDKFINPKKAVYSKSKGQSKKANSFVSARGDDEGEADGPRLFTQNYGEQVQDGNENANQSYSQQYQNGNETTVGGGSYAYNPPIEVPSQYEIPAPPIFEAPPPVFNIPTPSLRDIISPSYTIPFEQIAPVPPLPTPPVYEAPAYVAPPPVYVAPPPPPPVYVAPPPPPVYVAPIPPPPVYEEEPKRKAMPIEEVAAPLTTSTLFDDRVDRVLAPVGGGSDYQLPVYNPTKQYTPLPVFGNDGNPPSVDARTPVSGIGLTFGENATTSKNCPAGMRDYFGTCVPITNQYAVCQQGYMKEYEGGPCVPIPASTAIGGCAAGYEFKMGMRSGSLTPEMGCYPIGSNQDIGTGSSTGAILGGGSGSNIGGGGTAIGGGGNLFDDKILKPIEPDDQFRPRDMPDCVKFPFMCAPTPELPSGTTNTTTRPPVTSETTNTTTRPPLTTPEGTCPEGFEFNVQQQKCISKCPTGKTFDPVNKICVDPTIYTPSKPYCSANMEWDEAQQKCVFTGTITKPPVTSQTTNTTTKPPVKDTLGQLPTDGGGAMGGGGGGGGSEEEAPPIGAAKKNYFWWYVGGAVLAYYVYKKYYNKNN